MSKTVTRLPTADRRVRESAASSSEVCPICGGLGFTTRDVDIHHPDFGKAFPCQCRAAAAQEQRLRRYFGETAPLAVYRDFSFESWDALPEADKKGKERARELAGAFADGPFYVNGVKRLGLVLSGERGTSKTSLGTCVLREWTTRGVATMWIEFWRFIQQVKVTYGREPKMTTLEVVEALAGVPFLLIDDMGGGRGVDINDHSRNLAWTVLNERYCRLLPTLITTNLRWAEFADAFDYALAERINQIYEWCTVGGRNLRAEE